jgi:sensor c-di-GMP phosphodiesterase-like protein
MVLEIGETLGLVTIAEGIESEAERDHLLRLGCAFGQGWLFAPALPLDELIAARRSR